MPVPPKETIGTKPKHFQSLSYDFARQEYNYLVEMESFVETEDFQKLEEFERTQISEELEMRNRVYELLRQRVDTY